MPLRARLDRLYIPTFDTDMRAVAASGGPASSRTTLSRMMSARSTGSQNNRQLAIDVSRAEEATATNTDAARRAIQQGMNGVPSLAGAAIKEFRVWRTNDSTSVIKKPKASGWTWTSKIAKRDYYLRTHRGTRSGKSSNKRRRKASQLETWMRWRAGSHRQ